MKYFAVLFVLLLGLFPANAQKDLEGLWEGTITIGGIDSQEGHKFELFLEVDGKRVEGRSYIHLGEDNVIEMVVSGYLYMDRSIYLREIEFIPLEGSEIKPHFSRKYQMIYTRSVFDSTLEGFWQQDNIDAFNKSRQRGRISLRKKDASRA